MEECVELWAIYLTGEQLSINAHQTGNNPIPSHISSVNPTDSWPLRRQLITLGLASHLGVDPSLLVMHAIGR